MKVPQWNFKWNSRQSSLKKDGLLFENLAKKIDTLKQKHQDFRWVFLGLQQGPWLWPIAYAPYRRPMTPTCPDSARASHLPRHGSNSRADALAGPMCDQGHLGKMLIFFTYFNSCEKVLFKFIAYYNAVVNIILFESFRYSWRLEKHKYLENNTTRIELNLSQSFRICSERMKDRPWLG